MPSYSLPPAFLMPSSCLPTRFLLPSSCLPPAFLLHSSSILFPSTHIYILQDIFQRLKKYPFYTFTLFKKLFSENIWSFGLEFITLQPDTSKRRRNNGNDRRQLYSRAPKQRKRKCVLYSLFDLWSNC